MIKIKVLDKNNKELSFLIFKKASSFALRTYRKNMYFQKKKNK
ncbi:hypothetical protein [endosymbiont DhMRE of Dentiscutata heterogama]|nr:hypothetical protein [endosymbiont DhMRE of Dentiscutata heterogama]